MVKPTHANQRGAFTLLELLVVIAIIVIVTTLTLVAYRNVASDMRMSAAVQDVGSALEQARARAIRDGRPTIVALRPRVNSGGQHYVEAVVGQSSDEAFNWSASVGSGQRSTAIRFAPIIGLQPREMPKDMGFAAPAHQFGDDELYVATSRVGVNGEPPGIIPAIMYGPDGEVIQYDQESDASLIFIDFNADGGQRMGGLDYCNHWEPPSFDGDPACPPDRRDGFVEGFVPPDGCWVLNRRLDSGLVHPNEVVLNETVPLCARNNDDEPFVVLATELMLFDEKAARERYVAGAWSDSKLGAATRGKNLTEFINETGRRIRLNRYTGVSQRAQ